jgi:hypothetical protein
MRMRGLVLTSRFSLPTIQKPFHILSVAGLAKSGKTHLGASAPGDVGFQSLDFGTDGIIQKFPEKAIYVAEYGVSVDLAADEALKEKAPNYDKLADEQAMRITRETWKPFKDDFTCLLQEKSIKSIVWDRADEVNEVLRLANFGRLERNPQLAYGLVNAEYKGLVRQASAARKNLIMLHAMDTKYKTIVDQNGKEKSVPTDELKRCGNSRADFLVHSFIELTYTEPVRNAKNEIIKPSSRKCKILRARLNPPVDGMVLESPDWVTLMMFLMPDVPSEAWL